MGDKFEILHPLSPPEHVALFISSAFFSLASCKLVK
jgi:hypothetical protein